MSNNIPCTSPCINAEYLVNGLGTAEWKPCNESSSTSLFVETGTYWFCHNGEGVTFNGGCFGFPTGNQEVCGCND